MNCVVPGRESRSRVQSHRFPKDVKAGEQWLKVINPVYVLYYTTLFMYYIKIFFWNNVALTTFNV